MTWKIKDEFLDLKQGKHTVVFHNPDTGGEHHLVNLLRQECCPACGRSSSAVDGTMVDLHHEKAKKLKELNDHHKRLTEYREKHPHVRLGTEPK